MIAKRGGEARARTLTAEQRKAIATKASKAAAVARKRKAKEKGAKTLVVTGSSTNVGVLYTVTTAARMHRYNIVMPMDGVNASTRYEQEYSLHQFTVMPSDANKLFQFTNLSMITFR